MKHLMIDIETLGNKSNSVITEIAAVFFDLETGELGDEYHIHIDPQSCVEEGMVMNVDTVLWWMKQDDAARAGFEYPNKARIDTALQRFRAFIMMNSGVDEVRPWGNSARFDLGILTDAYDAIGKDIPWKFYNELDVRTLVFMKPEVRQATSFKGVPHNALDDCKHQVNFCTQTYKTLKGL